MHGSGRQAIPGLLRWAKPTAPKNFEKRQYDVEYLHTQTVSISWLVYCVINSYQLYHKIVYMAG